MYGALQVRVSGTLQESSAAEMVEEARTSRWLEEYETILDSSVWVRLRRFRVTSKPIA